MTKNPPPKKSATKKMTNREKRHTKNNNIKIESKLTKMSYNQRILELGNNLTKIMYGNPKLKECLGYKHNLKNINHLKISVIDVIIPAEPHKQHKKKDIKYRKVDNYSFSAPSSTINKQMTDVDRILKYIRNIVLHGQKNGINIRIVEK